jgi:hypothetical protein
MEQVFNYDGWNVCQSPIDHTRGREKWLLDQAGPDDHVDVT